MSNFLKNTQITPANEKTSTINLDWILPTELEGCARLELLPLLDNFDGGLAVNKLKTAAMKMRSFAQRHNVPPLLKTATRLFEAIENFDIATIDNIREKLKTIMSSETNHKSTLH